MNIVDLIQEEYFRFRSDCGIYPNFLIVDKRTYDKLLDEFISISDHQAISSVNKFLDMTICLALTPKRIIKIGYDEVFDTEEEDKK